MKLASRLLKREDWTPGDKFGMRLHPILGVWKMHNGKDIKTRAQKWPLYALEHGVVVATGFRQSEGKFIIIEFPRIGLRLELYHLDIINVKQRQRVTHATVLGKVGTTGGSTGVHLHLGVKRIGSNEWIDPDKIDYQPIEATKLVEDGSWGPQTMWRAQLALGQWPDGEMSGQIKQRSIANIPCVDFGISGSAWVRQFQRDHKLWPDGYFGPKSVMTFQKDMGAPLTGVLLRTNDPAVKEMQRRINCGQLLWKVS